MQALLYILWFLSCVMVIHHMKKWRYEDPDKNDYLITGLYIILAVIVLPAYALIYMFNKLI